MLLASVLAKSFRGLGAKSHERGKVSNVLNENNTKWLKATLRLSPIRVRQGP
jgi:hypothetical protein